MRCILPTLLMSVPLLAQAPASKADLLAPLRFLVGEWRGEGAGKPGQPSGVADFRFELGGRVLLRRNVADTVTTAGHLPARHEDLMTIFTENGQVKAFYLDNESHVIRYLVEAKPDGAVFTSEPGPGPRFRLSYVKKSETLVTVRFEIAPPGKPEAYSVYLEADTHKTK